MPGNINDLSDYEKDFLCTTRDRPGPLCLVSSRNNARNFEAELEEQENLGVITDYPWKELENLSQAFEIKLIEADVTFKLLNHGRPYIQFTKHIVITKFS